MALALTIDTPFGISAAYHKITHIDDDPLRNTVTVTVKSWTDRQHRLDNETKPLNEVVYFFSGEDNIDSEGRDKSYPLTNDQTTNDKKVVYLRIKTFPEWNGAVDC